MLADLSVDDALAAAAAATLAGAWSTASLGTIAGAPDAELARALLGVLDQLDGKLRRVAATEVARAFNDERESILIVLGGGGTRADGLRPADQPRPGLFKVYSAVLDRLTCARCFRADGETIEPHKSFRAGPPPLHPNCRCIVEHVIVAKPERLEDIAIDYDLFKQELAQVIAERRIISDRQALRFTTDSLGARRSPEVLTKRLANEPYATRR